MRKLIATEFVTMDGVFEEPGHWPFDFFNAEAGQFKYGELMAADAQLLMVLRGQGATLSVVGALGIAIEEQQLQQPGADCTALLRLLAAAGPALQRLVDAPEAADLATHSASRRWGYV